MQAIPYSSLRTMVHASFNVSSESAKLFVTLSPSKGAEGYQLIDVYDQAPVEYAPIVMGCVCPETLKKL